MFDAHSDLHVELAEELLACLFTKSKWATGVWTWVSLSNLKIHYDSKIIHAYNGHFLPEKVHIEMFLTHLTHVGLVERNPDLFLKDKFFRVTPIGRSLLEAGGDGIYTYLSKPTFKP